MLIVLLLTGCSQSLVKIVPTYSPYGEVTLPLRENYRFAENSYDIEETEDGYDIIIHCIKETNNGNQYCLSLLRGRGISQ